jgi:type IV secretion system protein VirD4
VNGRTAQRATRFATMGRSISCVMAPPRSGKGVGLVVSTMLTWPHSAVVTDLKREIYELTSGWRGTEGKNRVLRFEPASSIHSVAFNPLDEIRLGTDHETGDMQNLASLSFRKTGLL